MYIQVYVFFIIIKLRFVLYCVGPGIIKSPSKESVSDLPDS